MKRSLLLALVLLFVGCGGGRKEEGNKAPADSTSAHHDSSSKAKPRGCFE